MRRCPDPCKDIQMKLQNVTLIYFIILSLASGAAGFWFEWQTEATPSDLGASAGGLGKKRNCLFFLFGSHSGPCLGYTIHSHTALSLPVDRERKREGICKRLVSASHFRLFTANQVVWLFITLYLFNSGGHVSSREASPIFIFCSHCQSSYFRSGEQHLGRSEPMSKKERPAERADGPSVRIRCCILVSKGTAGSKSMQCQAVDGKTPRARSGCIMLISNPSARCPIPEFMP